jgi:hypothetical protein
MKALRMLLLIGIGGGALWLGMRDSDAAKSMCRYCSSDGKCHLGGNMTCKSGTDGPGRPWCVSSSGCVFV